MVLKSVVSYSQVGGHLNGSTSAHVGTDQWATDLSLKKKKKEGI